MFGFNHCKITLIVKPLKIMGKLTFKNEGMKLRLFSDIKNKTMVKDLVTIVFIRIYVSTLVFRFGAINFL